MRTTCNGIPLSATVLNRGLRRRVFLGWRYSFTSVPQIVHSTLFASLARKRSPHFSGASPTAVWGGHMYLCSGLQGT
jgi:hypothetical protein